MEPLGRSQVLAYIEKLSTKHNVIVVSFEKSNDLSDLKKVQSMMKYCSEVGIKWFPQKYHHRPRLLSTLLDLLQFYRCFLSIKYSSKVDLLHCRSYVPTFVALAIKYTHNIPYIFDMRAFWPDEMVSAGSLRNGSIIYKLLKWLEDRSIRSAGSVVCLTEVAVNYLEQNDNYVNTNFCTIPTCTNLDKFYPDYKKKEFDDKNPFILGCVGTINSGWFWIDWMVAFFRAVIDKLPNAILRVISKDDPYRFYKEIEKQGINKNSVEFYSREPEKMPSEIRQFHAAVMFFTGDFSKLGSSPTRLGEILASGKPCVANRGIGDVGTIIDRFDVGVLVAENKDSSMQRAADKLLSMSKDSGICRRCREASENWFSLQEGVAKYDQLYDIVSESG